MSKLIKTSKDRCHECYACVRNCPAKAVSVKGGQAEVIEDRCINCANCVNICSQGAKNVIDYIDEVRNLLAEDRRVIAGIAPSFPAYEPELTFKDWRNSLMASGFSAVYEVAWGAQLMINEYRKYLQQAEEPVISTACPVIVNFVEKYYPRLVPNLAPIVSPMGALIRYLKEVEEEAEIVLIGPCHAKKGEFEYNKNVAAVLTFSEYEQITDGENHLAVKNKLIRENGDIEGDIPGDEARQIPLAGGLLQAVSEGELSDEFIKVEGREKTAELFDLILSGEIKPRFIDALFCEGCINGVDLLESSFYKKEIAINRFIDFSSSSGVEYNKEYMGNINLAKVFREDYQDLPQPDDEEIWAILNKTNKYEEDDLLNCGACGYNTCREKAIAVYQDLAEVNMCLPYLLSDKRTEIERVQELNYELDSIINSSYDGMVVINKDGKIERVNKAYLEMIDMNREELLGKDLTSLEEERIIYPSVSLLCRREKRNITLVQNTKAGKRILVTATPLIDGGQVKRIIVNARDINDLDVIINDPDERNKLKVFLKKNRDSVKEVGVGHIITRSAEMKNIIELARKIGDTDSTVLITGESGVGKEVVARYIHEQSEERESFVKINCAAIPERLLESELFGYETGAFSGARREGKSGLIEKADEGTLFLDEIGEMPLNMQAKLLQVIQEHRVTRIGGVESIKVNFRLITATNRNIKKMVKNQEFREDLFYRLNVVPIHVPPLRERKEDILPLVNYFTNKFNDKYDKNIKLINEALNLLYEYSWPGNVRELINLLERVIVTTEGDIVDREFLQKFVDFEGEEEPEIAVTSIMPIKEAVARVEKKLLLMAKEQGKTTYEMANLLGVNQSTVVRKMNKYFS